MFSAIRIAPITLAGAILLLCAGMTRADNDSLTRRSHLEKAATVVPLKAVGFDLDEVRLDDGPFKKAQELDRKYLHSLDADRLLKVADAGQGRGVTLINASALDERLREQDCRANVIHVAPTRSMLADALAQYLVWKKWDKWVLL